MSQHAHVHVNHGVAISDAGELLEQFTCRCGATWTKTYQVIAPEWD
ncbi:hypothetical protein [Streptomyces piniterrae]|nr:hypothetical protein [Streptomyces piniterrae]